VREEVIGALRHALKGGTPRLSRFIRFRNLKVLVEKSRGLMAEKLGKSLALSLKDSTFVIRAKQLMTVLTTPLPPSKGRC
jgi:hypothetical protein